MDGELVDDGPGPYTHESNSSQHFWKLYETDVDGLGRRKKVMSVQFIPIPNGRWGALAACSIVCQLFRSQQFLKQCSWLKPVHEWILSIQLVFGRPRVRLPDKDPCIIVFARESVCLDTCPNHCNLRRLTICISGSNSPIMEVTSCVTEMLVRFAV